MILERDSWRDARDDLRGVNDNMGVGWHWLLCPDTVPGDGQVPITGNGGAQW